MLVCAILLLFAPFARSSGDIYLSSNLIPSHYDLLFTFDLDPESKFAYVGVVAIEFTVISPIDKIVLHADSLNILENKVSLAADNGDVPSIIDVDLSDMYDFLVVKLSDLMVAKQNYTLTVPFSGNLFRNPYGLFVTSYKEADGTVKHMVLSNFKPIHAHRAFPCFDEPQYKATFSIVIGHHVNMKAISNMPILNSTNINPLSRYWPMSSLAEKFKIRKDAFAWDEFARTPKMSTYLVAIVVTDMVSMLKTRVKDSQMDIKMWSTKAISKATLNNGAALIQKLITAHVDYLKMRFPIPNFEVIAIPVLSQPCYEHWGLLVCDEDIVLHKEGYTPEMKELALTELSQRIAQQWFGGLVTCRTWTDAWINEGLSRVIVPFTVATVDRDNTFEKNYLMQHLLRLLQTDSIKSALPLHLAFEEPRDILRVLNSDVHGKACLVMNMVFKLMTYDTFRLAVHTYLQDHSQGLSDLDSFCTSFSSFVQYSRLPALASFKEMLRPWVIYEGYPLLKVYRDDFTDTAIKLNQQHYVAPKYDSRSTVAWWIPFSIVTNDQPIIEHYWLPLDEYLPTQPFVIQQTANVSCFVIANSDSLTPMRVTYDERNWVSLQQLLTSNNRAAQLTTAARAQIVSDAFALAWSDHIDYNIPITLVNYLMNETEWAPFHAAFISLERIDTVLAGSIDYTVFQRYVIQLIKKLYKHDMGYTHSNDLFQNKLQVAGIHWACLMKVPDCEQAAIAHFDDWMKAINPEKNPIPIPLREVVYRVALSRGGIEQWRFAIDAANASLHRRPLLRALVHSTDLSLLRTALEWTINDELSLDQHERIIMLCEALLPAYSYPVTKEFIYKRIDDLLKRGGEYIGELMKTLTRRIITQEELDEFNAWSEKNQLDLERFRLEIRQGVDYAKENIIWSNTHQPRVIDLMKKHSPAPDPVGVLTRRRDLKTLFGKDIDRSNKSMRLLVAGSVYLLMLMLITVCGVSN